MCFYLEKGPHSCYRDVAFLLSIILCLMFHMYNSFHLTVYLLFLILLGYTTPVLVAASTADSYLVFLDFNGGIEVEQFIMTVQFAFTYVILFVLCWGIQVILFFC